MEASTKEVVELVADLSRVLDSDFFLVDVLNFVDKLVLPAIELDTLDILE